MKFKNLIRAGVLFGVAAIMAGTIVVSSTQENQDDRSAQSIDRKSTRLNSSHNVISRMPSSA